MYVRHLPKWGAFFLYVRCWCIKVLAYHDCEGLSLPQKSCVCYPNICYFSRAELQTAWLLAQEVLASPYPTTAFKCQRNRYRGSRLQRVMSKLTLRPIPAGITRRLFMISWSGGKEGVFWVQDWSRLAGFPCSDWRLTQWETEVCCKAFTVIPGMRRKTL